MSESQFPSSLITPSFPASGVRTSVLIPAITGIIIIEQVFWKLISISEGGTTGGIIINGLTYETFAASAGNLSPASDGGSIEGPIVGRFNTACQIEFSVGIANVFLGLRIKSTAI